ncbi:M91 family zinc metallopeptidase [Lysobacter antibioticus]|uniref:M91 family zinc metallopeptidase n=1 Tax=Lysobacter antibioticus TaxID=84531 RepID=UPI00034CB7C3|nr:M91 family zinc metallopeptidase [Lysobacter antibioticus]
MAGPTPIVINGGVVPPGSPAADTSRSTPDGKGIVSQELFRQGDIVISREQVTGGDQFADTLVINGGAGDDNVRVSQRANGVLDVNINGQPFEITLAAQQQLGVRGGDGNDVIHAASNVRVNMDVQGGDGNDTITTGRGRDRVDGGAGDDVINTGRGRDDVFGNTGNDTIDAGAGNDVVYGGDGDDILRGGQGRDYIEGGRGADTLEGGQGNDILSGGQDADVLRGGQGNDRIYTGAGADTVDNRAGRDTVYGQSGEDTVTATRGARNTQVEVDMTTHVGASVTVAAGSSDAFRQRVEADLDMLRSSNNGREMLAELDRNANAFVGTGHSVSITELSNEMNGYAGPSLTNDAFLQTDPATGVTTRGAGMDSVISYNPSFHSDFFETPTVVLHHEMSHAYNITGGTLQQGVYSGTGPDSGSVRNFERQAVGLDNSGVAFDFDRNAATPDTKTNPANLTENGMRDEMGLARRQNYSVDAKSAFSAPGNPSATGAGGNGGHNHNHAHLDALLQAMESGDRNAARDATRQLAGQAAGQELRHEAMHAADRQEQAAQAQAQQTQAEPTQSAGGMRR